jgi:hypothetical protein
MQDCQLPKRKGNGSPQHINRSVFEHLAPFSIAFALKADIAQALHRLVFAILLGQYTIQFGL